MSTTTNGADYDMPQEQHENSSPKPPVFPANRALEKWEVRQILRQIELDMEAALRAVGRLELRIDSSLQYTYALESSLVGHFPPTPSAPEPNVKPLGAKAAPSERAGAVGAIPEKITQVEELKFEWLSSGAALVRVNNSSPFRLPPALARLLQILGRDDRQTADALVGWKSVPEVAGDLAKELKRNFTKRTIDQLVYRLRRALFVGGNLSETLVHSHPQLGLRFAVKHQAKPVTG